MRIMPLTGHLRNTCVMETVPSDETKRRQGDGRMWVAHPDGDAAMRWTMHGSTSLMEEGIWQNGQSVLHPESQRRVNSQTRGKLKLRCIAGVTCRGVYRTT